jgi:pimeloyl-ACP methyl ester carboxylesterase
LPRWPASRTLAAGVDAEHLGAVVGRGEEIRAAGRLVGDVLAGAVGTVRDVHQAVAGRAFAAVGPAALPVRVLHDGIAGGVYAAVRGAHAALPRAVCTVAASGVSPDQPPLSASLPGGLVLAVANGLWGDTLSRRHPDLALAMTVRAHNADVAVTTRALGAAFPRATPRIVLFAHGLCETEQYWRLSSRRHYGTDHTTHGSRLERDLGYTAVYLRYNSGLRVSDNGRQLAHLLDDLVTGWPVPVEEVTLVGHSMGGLVIRSACHQAATGQHRWTPLVRHVFCLGTPHLGAPLEKGINVVAWLLSRFPETRPAARLLNLRSRGVKDLRFGALVDDDWRDADPDEFLRDRCTEVPFLPHASYYFIGATLAEHRDHPLATIVGDLFVRFPSASGHGRRRRIPFALDNGGHLGGLHHFDLLNHPDVYNELRTWLTTPTTRVSNEVDEVVAPARTRAR